jgi:hypothetical protein
MNDQQIEALVTAQKDIAILKDALQRFGRPHGASASPKQ